MWAILKSGSFTQKFRFGRNSGLHKDLADLAPGAHIPTGQHSAGTEDQMPSLAGKGLGCPAGHWVTHTEVKSHLALSSYLYYSFDIYRGACTAVSFREIFLYIHVSIKNWKQKWCHTVFTNLRYWPGPDGRWPCHPNPTRLAPASSPPVFGCPCECVVFTITLPS